MQAKIMGIVNVTPDSFSDGGEFLDPGAAIAHGRRLATEGADVLDVGGESTRPGAEAVDAAEELRRVGPVVEALAAEGQPVSIDTAKASVAEAALDAGATIVNDVTALRADPDLAALCGDRGCEVVLMHMLGTPRTMQDDPRYEDVVDDVRAFLAERIEAAVAAGVDEERIWVDPGIGFGKTVEHNCELLR
ncbi:MAG TPA: dihydropteroate synthase, partial [Solirubrobacterales bacterium]|nr:dihydropteroate synthase [Solirubrobacterales bacterium]